MTAPTPRAQCKCPRGLCGCDHTPPAPTGPETEERAGLRLERAPGALDALGGDYVTGRLVLPSGRSRPLRLASEDFAALEAALGHGFDDASVLNPETGKPYPLWSGTEPQDWPDPQCICGAPWLEGECSAQITQLRAQVSVLQAEVARLEAERDRLQVVIDANPAWAAYLTVVDDAELRRYAEDLAREVRVLRAEAKDARAEVRQLAHELGLTAVERDEARAELEDRGKALAQYQLACGQHQSTAFEAQAAKDEAVSSLLAQLDEVTDQRAAEARRAERAEAERDELRARVEVAVTAYQRELAGHVTAQRERDEALAERDTYRSAVEMYEGGIDEWAVERDAMREVVEAAEVWRAMRAGTPTKPKPEAAALIAAIDQMGVRTDG